MLFNSLNFFIFLAVFIFIYFLLFGKLRLIFCLLSSYFFYCFFSFKFSLIIIVSTLIDFIIGKKIGGEKNPNNRKIYLSISLFLNLIILGIFKYFNFFIDSFLIFLSLFGLNISYTALSIALPVGISFYTFQSMSYSLDVYYRRCKVENCFIRFATFVSFFPQLVAGPIVRAKRLLPQFRINKSFKWSNLFLGCEYIIFGFFLKICVADRLGIIIDPTFISPQSYGGGAHIIASVGFSFQIYADFAGYSLIAIGIGRLLGFNFGVNFKRPYFAFSFQDFWRRWHISLSSWLRDYLYIPLGGNKFGIFIKYRNFIIVMFLGGLWHGASINFLIWGVLHGILLILNDLMKKNFFFISPNIFNKFTVFLTVTLLWIPFRSENLDVVMTKLLKISSTDNFLQNISYDLFNTVIAFTMVIIFLSKDFIDEKRIRLNKRLRIFLSLVFVWLISFLGVFEGSNFIYFRF